MDMSIFLSDGSFLCCLYNTAHAHHLPHSMQLSWLHPISRTMMLRLSIPLNTRSLYICTYIHWAIPKFQPYDCIFDTHGQQLYTLHGIHALSNHEISSLNSFQTQCLDNECVCLHDNLVHCWNGCPYAFIPKKQKLLRRSTMNIGWRIGQWGPSNTFYIHLLAPIE